MERVLTAGEKFLLNHPFYQDWTNGKLCKEDLAIYAAEYFYFIRKLLPEAWLNAGFPAIYEEEIEHAELWDQFGKAVGYNPEGYPKTESMRKLEGLLSSIKNNKPALIGFLYAFEHQQPEISKSKLEGLEKFFDVQKDGKRYFVEHSKVSDELKILEEEINKMSDENFKKCEETFKTTVNLLWNLLSDIQQLASGNHY